MRRFFLTIRRRLKLTKREKFAIIALVLTIGLVATQLVAIEDRLKMVGILFVTTYLLAAWGLSDDLGGIEWFSLLILPSFFTTAVSLFYFLLPIRWLTRLPVAIIYSVGIYALLLIGNIYNVAVERSIQLVRAAHAIGLLMSVVTMFLILNTIYALRLPAIYNFMLIFFFLIPLTYQALWVMTLETWFSHRLFTYTVSIAFSIASIGLILSFWPTKGVIASLFLATMFYSSVGMTQQHLIGRLFFTTLRTFLLVMAFVFIILGLTTRWGG